LADAYALSQVWSIQTLPRDTAFAWAKAAALRAIALDSTLAEPHASLNQILRYGYWDWTGSEREVRRAIALDPNYATAHQWLAEHLLDMDRLNEAIAEARAAVQLDPLAQMPQNILGAALWYAGRIDEADTVFRAAIARDSSAVVVARGLFMMYVTTGRTQDASALLAAQHDTSSLNHALVRARSDPAARTAALALLGRLRAQRLPGKPGIKVAQWYAVLGERETALAMLEQAAAEQNPALEMIKVEPVWDSVRHDPRFAAVVRQIGLSP
ncbi:MAG TPA: bacterial transcriptional activator domain-containing protein, partial [Gemmatimonadales bacterium]|nr:bacterial transcriptional activator domain-containing protein [Gemmatimonadales bacterium]